MISLRQGSKDASAGPAARGSVSGYEAAKWAQLDDGTYMIVNLLRRADLTSLANRKSSRDLACLSNHINTRILTSRQGPHALLLACSLTRSM